MKRPRSWFDRLRASLGRAEPEPAPAAAPPQTNAPPSHGSLQREDALGILKSSGDPGADPGRALDALGALLGTPGERAALDAVAVAAADGRVPESVRIAAARALVERGEPARALGLLAEVCSSVGLLLAADLCADRGELARAVSLVERLLARDLDSPGACERRDRWLDRLGVVRARNLPMGDATLLTPDAPETGLRLVAEVGRGGAGTVYEAIDDALGRRVALKVYHCPKLARAQLIREATLAARLAGTGVARVFDADPERGWLVMEWLPGGSLKRAIVRGDTALMLPLERWLGALVEIVGDMHGQGLVHADLKPANVLFRAGGEPVLTDLGLSAAPGGHVRGGSAGYMSPERLERRPLSPRDDVYALGRIIEDVLEATERADSRGASPAWRELVAVATSAARPAGARELLPLVRSAAEKAVLAPNRP